MNLVTGCTLQAELKNANTVLTYLFRDLPGSFIFQMGNYLKYFVHKLTTPVNRNIGLRVVTSASIIQNAWYRNSVNSPLKVPKREIFDRSDFPDFYIIKSLCVGDVGVKIKKF